MLNFILSLLKDTMPVYTPDRKERKMKRLLAAAMAMMLISVAYVLVDGAETMGQQEALIVQNSKGEYVGIITDALIDPSGNIGFLIVSIGEKMGPGEKEIAVPTESFSTNPERKLLLDISKERLAEAPEFKMSDLKNPAFAETVYRFFGLVPAWTDGAPGVEM
jgi:hypothetical protein